VHEFCFYQEWLHPSSSIHPSIHPEDVQESSKSEIQLIFRQNEMEIHLSIIILNETLIKFTNQMCSWLIFVAGHQREGNQQTAPKKLCV
jgi:hypothetical protein